MDDDEHARALVDRARGDDSGAARELIRQLYPLVARIARAHRPRRTAEEDLCQMIFVKVFQNLHQYSGKYLSQCPRRGKSPAGIALR